MRQGVYYAPPAAAHLQTQINFGGMACMRGRLTARAARADRPVTLGAGGRVAGPRRVCVQGDDERDLCVWTSPIRFHTRNGSRPPSAEPRRRRRAAPALSVVDPCRPASHSAAAGAGTLPSPASAKRVGEERFDRQETDTSGPTKFRPASTDFGRFDG